MDFLSDASKSRYLGKYRVTSTRMQGWDYASPATYMVTICTKHREPWFGEIKDGIFVPTRAGIIARDYWADIPVHFPHVSVDTYVIMPDHVHGILLFHPFVEMPHGSSRLTTGVASLQTKKISEFGPLKPGSLSKVIQAYKAAVSNWSHKNGYGDFEWQQRFHEDMIRDSKECDAMRHYIRVNRLVWEEK